MRLLGPLRSGARPQVLRRFGAILALALLYSQATSCSPGWYSPDPKVTAEDTAAAWSPDGAVVAYLHFTPNLADTAYPSGFYLVDTLGTPPKRIRSFGGSPDWSQDGSSLAFHAGGIAVLDLVSDSIHLVVASGVDPSFSPDGQTLAFTAAASERVGAHAIWTVGRDGTGLSSVGGGVVGEWRHPDWSSDGARILHMRYLAGVLGSEVFVMNSDGGAARRLTYNGVDDRNPQWSPDGTKIIWTSLRRGIDMEIWLADTSGGNSRRVVAGHDASWGPDNASFVHSARASDGSLKLFISSTGGATRRQLTP